MAKMIKGYMCSGCGCFHKFQPFEGYVVGLDTSKGEDYTALIIGKVIPDGEGGVEVVVLDIQTRPPEAIG